MFGGKIGLPELLVAAVLLTIFAGPVALAVAVALVVRESSKKTKPDPSQTVSASPEITFCGMCGKPVARDSNFCISCGTRRT